MTTRAGEGDDPRRLEAERRRGRPFDDEPDRTVVERETTTETTTTEEGDGS